LDPRAERDRLRKANAPGVTFRGATERFFEDHKAGWRSPIHREQWWQSMRDYVFPAIGDKPVAGVTAADVVALLKRDGFWETKTVTASRVRERVAQVLDFATAHDLREGDNPAAWSRLKFMLPDPKKLATVEHHPAVAYADVPKLMSVLADMPGLSPQALRFLILTGGRTGEVTGARWDEIDMKAAVWTVPSSRMKSKREHRVPLSEAALDVLRSLPRTDGAEHVFPGIRGRKFMSETAMLKTLEKVIEKTGLPHATIHGMRSAFRTWVAEQTSFPREIAEEALAHTVGNAVERAYQRSKLLEQRRLLMDAWARHCIGAAPTGNVTPLRAA
jgi:integrase